MRLLRLCAAALLSLGACCAGGDAHLTLGFGLGAGLTTPPWGREVTHRVSERPSLVTTADPEHPISGASFEVYVEGAPEPVSLRCTDALVDNQSRDGCGTSRDIVCDLTTLAPARYEVVHRESHGNGDALNCVGACPWTTFRGERALRFVLVLLPRL